MAESLYRKYRPQTFDEVVGQEHIERTLKNAIEQDKVSHAYLLCGPRGTGKTTTARLIAKALLCQNGPTPNPDGTCRDCVDIANGVHPDVYELDAASRTGVENVREEIIGRVNFAPTRGTKKVYIIDEVHMLSTAAFNALLKTLEEPPAHVIFILCTTDPQKVPETIHSRCQRFDFHRLSTDEIVSRLGAVCVAEGVEFEGDALELIAHRADGGMRNALTALEQLIAFGEGKVTLKGAEDLLGALDSNDMAAIVTAVGRRDAAACFNWVADYVETGADLAQFARDMAEHIRNMYVLTMAGSDAAVEIPEVMRRELVEEAKFFGPDRLARLLAVLGDVIAELRNATNQRLAFEIALTRMIRPDSDLTLASLAERIEALESGYSATTQVLPAAAPAAAPAPAPAPVAQPRQAAVAPRQQVPTAPRPQAAPMPAPAPAPAPTPAPAPAPAPVTAAAAPATPMPSSGNAADLLSNSAALQRAWKSVVNAVKKAKVSYGVLFVNVKVRPDENGTGLVLQYPADSQFTYDMAQKPEVQEVLSTCIRQATGFAIPFRCEQVAATVAPAASAAPVAAAPVYTPPVEEEVPLEAYGFAPAAPASAPAPATSMPPTPPDTVSSATSTVAPASADDMSSMLSEVMGSGIVFEEVDE